MQRRCQLERALESKINSPPIYAAQMSIRKSTRKQFSICAILLKIALRHMPANEHINTGHLSLDSLVM